MELTFQKIVAAQNWQLGGHFEVTAAAPMDIQIG